MALTEEETLSRVKLILIEHYAYIPSDGAYIILTDMEMFGLTNLATYKGMSINLLKRDKKLRITIIIRP